MHYQPPSNEERLHAYNYYTSTQHFGQRYRKRMSTNTSSKLAKKNMLEASDQELERRANYMLMFSIHGRPGKNKHTEVRFYFEWNIVVDNRRKKLVTMYIDEHRRVPNAKYFGSKQMRKMIYNLWFKPHSKIHQNQHLLCV